MEFTTLSAQGLKFVVAVDGEGPDVVLLHGFPDTPHSWAPLQRSLVDAGYRTIVPWLRGYHAETIVPGRPYDPETIARDALLLLDAVGSSNAVLVGHDWGALIAYGAAALAPERVPAIATFGIAHPSLMPRNLALLWSGRHLLAHRLPWAARSCRRDSFAYFDKLYRRWAPNWSGPDRDRSLAEAKRALASDATLNGALSYYRDLPLRLRGPAAKLPTVPGLIVGGTDDEVQLNAFAATAGRLPPPSRALLVDGGHWPHREDHATVERELLAFLAQAPGVKATAEAAD